MRQTRPIWTKRLKDMVVGFWYSKEARKKKNRRKKNDPRSVVIPRKVKRTGARIDTRCWTEGRDTDRWCTRECSWWVLCVLVGLEWVMVCFGWTRSSERTRGRRGAFLNWKRSALFFRCAPWHWGGSELPSVRTNTVGFSGYPLLLAPFPFLVSMI